MGISTEVFVKLTCERCGHQWKPVLPQGQLPRKCPGCQAPNWNQPIQYPRISESRKAYFQRIQKKKT